MKRLIYVAEPDDWFTQDQWSVIAYNMDDDDDIEQVAGPFPTQSEAEFRSAAIRPDAKEFSHQVTPNPSATFFDIVAIPEYI